MAAFTVTESVQFAQPKTVALENCNRLSRERIHFERLAAVHAEGPRSRIGPAAGWAGHGRFFNARAKRRRLLVLKILDQLDECVVSIAVLLLHERPQRLRNQKHTVNIMLHAFELGLGLARGVFRLRRRGHRI
jgi:hypothetical protein